jgi:hypothetical protein
MQIRIETRRTGREILEDILSRWGSGKAIAQDDSPEAMDALFWWNLLQDESRLDQEHVLGETIELDAEDLRMLSRGRIALLKHVAEHQGEALGKIAEHLGRDLANVKRDTDKLSQMGLLRTLKKGRELRVSPAGNSIQIDLLA